MQLSHRMNNPLDLLVPSSSSNCQGTSNSQVPSSTPLPAPIQNHGASQTAVVQGHQHTYAHDRCRCQSQEDCSAKTTSAGIDAQSFKDIPVDSAGFPVPRTFDELVQLIRMELGSHGLEDKEVNVPRLQAILSNYKSTKDEWQRFAFYDACRYTRNLVDDGNGKYNLLLLCWGPQQQSPIHDHAGAHCVLKVMEGSLTETRFAWPKAGQSGSAARSSHDQLSASSELSMRPTESFVLERDQAAYMHDKIGLHRVGNPSTDQAAVSLHLYSPPIQMCQTFCERTGTARNSGKCVFFSVKGERTRACAAGLGADGCK